MRTAMKTLWFCSLFAAAAASDCGAPVNVVAWIVLAWAISAVAWLEIIRRQSEQRDQRRLSQCRSNVRMAERNDKP